MGLACCQRATARQSGVGTLQQHPHDTTSQTVRRSLFRLCLLPGFTSFLTHAKFMQVWAFCKMSKGEWVCELVWWFIYIGAFWTFDFSGHHNHNRPLCPPTPLLHLLIYCLSPVFLPPPDVFEHSCWVLAFYFPIFPTIFSFKIFSLSLFLSLFCLTSFLHWSLTGFWPRQLFLIGIICMDTFSSK